MKVDNLYETIIACKACSRLVTFRSKIAKDKRKSYKDWDYWGKPVPGYGNINSKIMILGLAPAAHGGNRTGRVFTGDKSSDFLYKCLYKAKISNQPTSKHINELSSTNRLRLALERKSLVLSHILSQSAEPNEIIFSVTSEKNAQQMWVKIKLEVETLAISS